MQVHFIHKISQHVLFIATEFILYACVVDGVFGSHSDVNNSVCVISSKSSPVLTAHRASSGSRSRHSSPVTDRNNIIAYLKEIRLHKYTDCLANFTWDEVQ